MIRAFKHQGLKAFFESGSTRGIQAHHKQRTGDILDLLNAAKVPSDMNFPGSFLHPPKENLKGYWAVRVSGNWRIVFQFLHGDAFVIDYVDYH